MVESLSEFITCELIVFVHLPFTFFSSSTILGAIDFRSSDAVLPVSAEQYRFTQQQLKFKFKNLFRYFLR